MKLSERLWRDVGVPPIYIKDVECLEREIERLRQRLGGAEASAMSALQNLTGIGYVLGQQAGESALESAKRVTAEINQLRADAERYVWIFNNCEVTYYKSDFPFATEDDLDAAMKGKE